MKSNKLIQLFLFVFGISFLGSVPPGTINLTGALILNESSFLNLMVFAIGVVIVEAVFVWILLLAFNWFKSRNGSFRILEWLSFFVILSLAIVSFYYGFKKESSSNIPIKIFNSYFVLGLFLSIINPLHIPFWLVWIKILIEKNKFTLIRIERVIFVVGLCIGTVVGLISVAFLEDSIFKIIKANNFILSLIIGSVLLLTALWQLLILMKKQNKNASIVKV